MKVYEGILDSITPEVSYGYEKVYIHRSAALESAQVGYSVRATGESLTGDRDGDWHRNWVVIGYEELCGDPIFIDTSREGFPVYTAMHGTGRWDAQPIAVSLEAFDLALKAIARIAIGREHPGVLAQNPLPASEKDATISAIRRANPGIDLEFWEVILTE
jgi:hypothetical protein